MAYWLDVFSPGNWEEFIDGGAQITGFPYRQLKAAQSIRPGDILLCYVKQQSQWVGALEVESEVFLDQTQMWEDMVYPCRVKVKPLVLLPLGKGLAARDMLPRLKLFAGLRNPQKWGAALGPSPKAIADEDGDMIVGELHRAPDKLKIPTDNQ